MAKFRSYKKEVMNLNFLVTLKNNNDSSPEEVIQKAVEIAKILGFEVCDKENFKFPEREEDPEGNEISEEGNNKIKIYPTLKGYGYYVSVQVFILALEKKELLMNYHTWG